MKPHTPDQVTAMKKFADSQPSAAERKTFELNGLQVTYTTVDMGEAKPFNYAVAAFVAPREDGTPITEADYEIAVSNDVPEELQGIWAWHELHDFAVLGHEAKDRCLQSEQVLADTMLNNPELYQRYLSVRTVFYENLENFALEQYDESVYTLDDVLGCYSATQFLESQKKKLAINQQLQTLESPLLNRVRAKRKIMESLTAQEALRIHQEAEQDRMAQEKEAALHAELKLESDKNATEFIKIMLALNIPTIDLYSQGAKREYKTAYYPPRPNAHYKDPGSRGMITSWYETTLTNKLMGQGWLVLRPGATGKSDGYVLLTTGLTYQVPYLSRILRPEIDNSTGNKYLVKGTDPAPGSVPWSGNVVEFPYAGDGATLLVDAIIRLTAQNEISQET